MSAMTDGIITKLTTDQSPGSFYDDLGGRVFGIQADQDPTFPYCVVTVIDDAPSYFFESDDIQASIQIDLYGSFDDGYKKLSNINDKLFIVL